MADTWDAWTAEDVRTLADPFFVPCQDLEDLAFGWVIDQIAAAFGATLREDLELNEAQIGAFFQSFLERVPERLRNPIQRTASIAFLKTPYSLLHQGFAHTFCVAS